MIRHNPAQIAGIYFHRVGNPVVGEVLAPVLKLVDIVPAAASVALEVDDAGYALQIVEALFAHLVVVPELPCVRCFLAEMRGMLYEDAVLDVNIWGTYIAGG